MIRHVGSDADLEAYVAVWNAVTPDDAADLEQRRERRGRDPRRLHLLAEREGAVVGCGFGGPSDSPGRGFVAPRVLPEARRRGLGTLLLGELADHLHGLGFTSASAHVDVSDSGSLAFAQRFGFEEVDRQVEQARAVGDEPEPAVPPGLELVSIAERPELRRAAYFEVAVDAYADLPLSTAVEIPLDDWLREEATRPEGSFVALEGARSSATPV